eukprot:4304498-Pyramimonas_sp.AAC.1
MACTASRLLSRLLKTCELMLEWVCAMLPRRHTCVSSQLCALAAPKADRCGAATISGVYQCQAETVLAPLTLQYFITYRSNLHMLKRQIQYH